MYNLQYSYNPSLDFTGNRKQHELSKACQKAFKSILDFTASFPEDSAVRILNTAFRDGFEILDVNWAARIAFNFTVRDLDNLKPSSANVEVNLNSLWRTHVDSTLPEDTFLTVKIETTKAVPILPFIQPQNEEIMDWLKDWIDANEDVSWSYSGITFRIIMELYRIAKVQILAKTPNVLHAVGYYQSPSTKQYEKIEIVVNNEIPLLTHAFFNDNK